MYFYEYDCYYYYYRWRCNIIFTRIWKNRATKSCSSVSDFRNRNLSRFSKASLPRWASTRPRTSCRSFRRVANRGCAIASRRPCRFFPETWSSSAPATPPSIARLPLWGAERKKSSSPFAEDSPIFELFPKRFDYFYWIFMGFICIAGHSNFYGTIIYDNDIYKR